jgi:hypothetical protein
MIHLAKVDNKLSEFISILLFGALAPDDFSSILYDISDVSLQGLSRESLQTYLNYRINALG